MSWGDLGLQRISTNVDLVSVARYSASLVIGRLSWVHPRRSGSDRHEMARAGLAVTAAQTTLSVVSAARRGVQERRPLAAAIVTFVTTRTYGVQ